MGFSEKAATPGIDGEAEVVDVIMAENALRIVHAWPPPRLKNDCMDTAALEMHANRTVAGIRVSCCHMPQMPCSICQDSLAREARPAVKAECDASNRMAARLICPGMDQASTFDDKEEERMHTSRQALSM